MCGVEFGVELMFRETVPGCGRCDALHVPLVFERCHVVLQTTRRNGYHQTEQARQPELLFARLRLALRPDRVNIGVGQGVAMEESWRDVSNTSKCYVPHLLVGRFSLVPALSVYRQVVVRNCSYYYEYTFCCGAWSAVVWLVAVVPLTRRFYSQSIFRPVSEPQRLLSSTRPNKPSLVVERKQALRGNVCTGPPAGYCWRSYHTVGA
jgi:hypothetical protein